MLLFLLPDTTTLAQPGETALEGNWRNPSGQCDHIDRAVRRAMCGRVQWASHKAVADARKSGTDPLVGVELLSGFVPKGANWWKGRLLVPDLKKTSKAEIRQLGQDQVKVTRCAIGRLVCKSQVWTRTKAE